MPFEPDNADWLIDRLGHGLDEARAPLVVDAGARRGPLAPGDPIVIGVDRTGRAPAVGPDGFDILLTTVRDVPAPWVTCADLDAELATLREAAEAYPVAAAVLADVLRLGEGLRFDGALLVESLSYSTLLGGEEFRRWRARTPVRSRPVASHPVRIEREGDLLRIVLDDPASCNAVSAALRDALVETLALPLFDTSILSVELTGAGSVFSSGGHLDEFGSTTDLAAAHRLRLQQSPVRLAHRLGARLTAHVHGAAIGGGLEIAAAAERVVARPGTMFGLPEVGMGLIPGAGGCASLPRRIGRHRTAFMAIGGGDLDVGTALGWGLVDALEAA